MLLHAGVSPRALTLVGRGTAAVFGILCPSAVSAFRWGPRAGALWAEVIRNKDNRQRAIRGKRPGRQH